MNEESRLLNALAVATERGYVDAEEVQALWFATIAGILEDIPDIKDMVEQPVETPVDITPEGKWSYEAD